MLQHILQFRRLVCNNVIELEHIARIQYSIVLSKLNIYIRFDTFFGDFDDFELLMGRLSIPVEERILYNVDDEDFLDALRWKRFIMQRTPLLRRLAYFYEDDNSADDCNVRAAQIVNQFASPFGIERQCFLEVTIRDHRIFYFARLCKYVQTLVSETFCSIFINMPKLSQFAMEMI